MAIVREWWAYIRPWMFPVACLGCDRAGVALCPACGPGPADRLREDVARVAVTAAGSYDGLLRRAVVAMKQGERAYLDPLAVFIAAIVPRGIPLVPLPTSRARRAARGFDQSCELARRAARLGGGVACDVLLKRGGPQRGRDREARLAGGARFAIAPQAALPEAAVVVDDVLTTGATLMDGIAALRSAGVAVIGAAVVARTPPGRNPRP